VGEGHDLTYWWERSRNATPRSLNEWMGDVDRELAELWNKSRGAGKTLWYDAEFDEERYRFISPYVPGWRRLHDGRIELRGRLERGSAQSGSWVPAAVNVDEVIMQLPYECSPPSNQQTITSMLSFALCSTANSAGLFQVEIRRDPAWVIVPVMEPLKDENGNDVLDENGDLVMVPVYDGEGEPVTENHSMVNVVAKPPNNQPYTGWIGFDGVVYDPNMYIDTVPPVPPGQEPLVHDPAYFLVQNADGSVRWLEPGIDYRS